MTKHYTPDKAPSPPVMELLKASPSPWLVANTIANVVIACILVGILIAVAVS